MSQLSIETVDDPRGLLIRLIGPADLANNDHLQRALTVAQVKRPKLVVLDLSGTTMLSSIAMGTLVSFRRGVVGHGGVAAIAAANELIADALKRVGLQQMFPLFDSVEAALGSSKAE